MPTNPVTLDVPQVEELARHFSSFRHDVNGCLSLVIAATELIRYNPDVIRRMSATLVEQPPRIVGKVREFINQCERVLGIRPSGESSWYTDYWKRHHAPPGEPTGPVSVPAESARNLHNDLLALARELGQAAFVVSGARVLAAIEPSAAADVAITAFDQLPKLTRKLDQVASAMETAFGFAAPAPRRLASGIAAGPVTFSSGDLMVFHQRLLNLEKDCIELLLPLLEMSRLVRSNPAEVQARSSRFAQQPPKINALLAEFSTVFDQTFGIVRNGGETHA